jgi:hypothetical protein
MRRVGCHSAYASRPHTRAVVAWTEYPVQTLGAHLLVNAVVVADEIPHATAKGRIITWPDIQKETFS